MLDRRSLIATSLAGAAALIEGCATAASQASASSGKVKLTILHHNPKDPAAFEKYYNEKHIPLVATVKGLPPPERSKPMPLRPGAPAPYYQMVEFRFDSVDHFRSVMTSPEWGKVADDSKNFNTEVTAIASRIV